MITLIEGSKARPQVSYDPASLKISLEGWSFMENPQQELLPLSNQLRQLSEAKLKPTIEFDLICYNTSSAKAFVTILKNSNDNLKQVIWKFDGDDEETKEWGEELEQMSGVDFHYSPR